MALFFIPRDVKYSQDKCTKNNSPPSHLVVQQLKLGFQHRGKAVRPFVMTCRIQPYTHNSSNKGPPAAVGQSFAPEEYRQGLDIPKAGIS